MIGKKQNKNSKKRIGILVIVLSVIIAGTTAWMFRGLDGGDKDLSDRSEPLAMFDFNESTAPGWKKGATNETSLAVFGSGDLEGCFLSVEYRPGRLDLNKELRKIRTEVESGGQYELKSAGAVSSNINTPSGPVKYVLQASDVDIVGDAESVKRGQSLGFIEYGDGHIKALGLCDTPEQRDMIYPAMSAFSVKPL